ncbi:MAG: HEAT repeat domain-containing protein [Cyanobacteria bacterium P01_D01_bin.71]
MGFVIGLIIGVALGAAIAYFLTSKNAAAQSAAVQDLQRQLALAESEHDRRLREATEQLRQDYEAQVTAAQAEAAAISTTASATAASEPMTPPAAPASAAQSSPEPMTAGAAAVIAPAPAPRPKQPVAERPLTADIIKPQRPSKGLQTSVRVSDPSAVLAASYSPQARTRGEVAEAIAQILPTAGAPAQARWLPILGRLSRDADPAVRLSAVQALAQMKSAKRLPILKRSLKDANPAVVAAANAIIAQTKGHSRSPSASKKRRLPKNR